MSSPTYVAATDLSQASRHGARVASELAAATGGRVDLFCAVPSDASADMETFVESVSRGLEGFAKPYTKGGAEVAQHLAVSSDAERSILKHVKKVNAAVLVIAPRGVTGAKKFLLGSMTERLIRSCPTRLLIARRAPSRDDQRVLIAVDGSAGSARALRAGLAICAARKARPIVVHVIAPPSSWVNVEETLSGTNSYKTAKARMKKARPAIVQWVTRFESKDTPALQVHIREGHAAEEILAQARASNAGMIVVGTQSRSRVQEFFVGSVARGVATHAKASVLLVRGTPSRPAAAKPKRARAIKAAPRKSTRAARRKKRETT